MQVIKISIALVLFLLCEKGIGQHVDKKIIDNSRNSCFKIISKQAKSSGTGFLISKDLIVTCFHVVAYISKNDSGIAFKLFEDLQAINETGDTVALTCISVPTNVSPEPLIQDFAILKTVKPMSPNAILKLSTEIDQSVGENIIFSGYPLGTPTMVTHFGAISGITKDKSIICIQAATNKGNSGGALIDNNGKVIGIVSMREGGISLALENYMDQINKGEKMGSTLVSGVDPLQVTKETVNVLDTFISTGIGYARSVSFLNDYLRKNKIKP